MSSHRHRLFSALILLFGISSPVQDVITVRPKKAEELSSAFLSSRMLSQTDNDTGSRPVAHHHRYYLWRKQMQ